MAARRAWTGIRWRCGRAALVRGSARREGEAGGGVCVWGGLSREYMNTPPMQSGKSLGGGEEMLGLRPAGTGQRSHQLGAGKGWAEA